MQHRQAARNRFMIQIILNYFELIVGNHIQKSFNVAIPPVPRIGDFSYVSLTIWGYDPTLSLKSRDLVNVSFFWSEDF